MALIQQPDEFQGLPYSAAVATQHHLLGTNREVHQRGELLHAGRFCQGDCVVNGEASEGA